MDKSTESKPPDSLRQEASQAAGAAPTLRYGSDGWYGRKETFRAMNSILRGTGTGLISGRALVEEL